jgi:hypothetical protein
MALQESHSLAAHQCQPAGKRPAGKMVEAAFGLRRPDGKAEKPAAAKKRSKCFRHSEKQLRLQLHGCASQVRWLGVASGVWGVLTASK